MAQSMFDRVLLAMLTRWRGSAVGAKKDLRQLREIQRFALLSFTPIVLSVGLLAYFAIASSRSEELTLDADLRSRANVAVNQAASELEDTFWRFEHAARIRAREGRSPVSGLPQLSPYLRAAFEFDENGQLTAPFGPARDLVPRDATPAFGRVFRMAELYEVEGKWEEALVSYQVAEDIARTPALAGEARFAGARVLRRAGRSEEAEAAFAAVYRDVPNERDQRGFRLGDLARMSLAELATDTEPDLGAKLMWDLTADLLSSEWAIGVHAEPALARRALDALEGHLDGDQLARTRARLRVRSDHLHWASTVSDELELYKTADPSGSFSYQARADSPSVWATARLLDHDYAFSFSAADLLVDLETVVERAGQVDEELTVSLRCGFPPRACVDFAGGTALVGPGDPQDGVLASRPLGPWLPYASIIVTPADPQALVGQKDKRRRVRIAIILVTVLTAVLGLVQTGAYVVREMRAARMKADFAANVSHELRSPITQIRVKAESLLFDLVPKEEERAYFAAIVRESERLTRLVDNVLDFAAIERGAKKYHLRPDDLAGVLFEAVEANMSTAEQKDCVLETDVPSDLPAVWIDREAIGQVLTNLISNAAKYGDDGGWICVSARVGVDSVDVCVSDRGMGIAPEELGQVFDEFFRSSSVSVRRRKGTGIGLAIVRYIVESHGGTISVESEVGQGTTFTVSLPLSAPPDADS
jgi:signal transduction histidine kinase